jgi:hypothetical protein
MSNNVDAKSFMAELGLEGLPPERQTELLLKLGETAFNGALIRLLELLDEKEAEELQKSLEELGEDGEKMINFLNTKYPNFAEMVRQELEKIKQEGQQLLDKLV